MQKSLVVVLGLAAGAAIGANARAELVYGVTLQQSLVTWDSSTPGSILTGVAISGLQSNEVIHGIDLRPNSGELYALGSMNRLYKINKTTGAATQIGPTFSTPLNGSSFGFDFNPTVDRVRVISDANQNLRLHPDTGAVVAVDTSLAYAAGDVNFGKNPNGVHAAYSNSYAGALTTTLYVLDTGLDVLAIQNPANGGQLMTVGSVGADLSDIGGFDISGLSGIAYATVRDNALARSTFWRIDLATGQGTMIGEIGGGAIITAMAVIPAPSSLGLMGVAALGLARRRRS
ncbi:MAG: DUF4394 domain-containing protein [Phycisphaeraceae bacterium]|nr:DUF4394 domain-containing protein [Phycisphaeraceae bacterium]